MKDGYERFQAQFRIPKKALHKIAEGIPESERLLNYTKMCDEIFDFFEKSTQKKINRPRMVEHLHYWFDEGFKEPEMKMYIQFAEREDYYMKNPAKYSIANLFPISGEDRIKFVWDMLAHQLSNLEAGKVLQEEILSAMFVRLPCGHTINGKENFEDPGCKACFILKDEMAIIENPYKALKVLPDTEEYKFCRELAYRFQRQDDKTLEEYFGRTKKERERVMKKDLDDSVVSGIFYQSVQK